MLPIGEDAAEGFYRLVDAAYERRSVAVTSNLHASGSRRADEHAHVVVAAGESFRGLGIAGCHFHAFRLVDPEPHELQNPKQDSRFVTPTACACKVTPLCNTRANGLAPGPLVKEKMCPSGQQRQSR